MPRPLRTWRLLALAATLVILTCATGSVTTAARATGEVIAADDLDRTTRHGWGTADQGGAWEHSDVTGYSAATGYGTVTLTGAGEQRSAVLPQVATMDGTGSVQMAVERVPRSGDGIYSSVLLREQRGRAYRATLRVAPGGRAYLSIARLNGLAIDLTSLSDERLLPDRVEDHQWLTVELAVEGTAPVRLAARAWPRRTPAPGWQVFTSDAGSGQLVAPGSFGLTTYTSRTGSAATVHYDTIRLSGDVPAESPPPSGPEPVQPVIGALGSAGSLPVGAAEYAVPSGALFVAPDGSDSAAGTAAAPLHSVQLAVDRARDGDTIVLREGTYRQHVTIDKAVTVQNYPREAVWFDGSSTVVGFVPDAAAWRLDGWATSFDSSPSFTVGDQSDGFLDPAYPMAAHPDQVWIDGKAQHQAASRSGLGPGQFYVDDAADRLYLGSDPSGRSVRASILGRAIEIRAAGATLRGVGVRRYAPSVPEMGAITVERPRVRVENLEVTDNSTIGISFLAEGIRANGLTVRRNGLLGVHGNHSDNLRLRDVRARENNAEHFSQSPVSGGLKITRSRGVSLARSTLESNDGPGVWLDESVYDGQISGCVIRSNAGHGISLEISGLMTVAGNLIQDNARFGIKINDTSDVSIWNNTVADNDRPINIVQDQRRGDDPGVPGHDPRRPIPDPTLPWVTGPVTVRNNVLAGSTGTCLLCAEDYSHEYSAERMGIHANNNVYQRDTSSAPEFLAIWSNGPGDPSVYRNLATFGSATGQETQSLELLGAEAVDPDGSTTEVVRRAAPSVATQLPSAITTLLGAPEGSAFLGVG